MPKGQNQCCWLYFSGECCGKSCVFEHCKQHRAQIKKGATTPVPCRGCGRGVRSETHLCRACGSNRVHNKLVYKGKKARDNFQKVLAELCDSYNKQLELHLTQCIPT